jgi:tRNA G18 (ribose-2'-O)-methylase SpoU
LPVIHHVTSLELPELQPYRTLRRPQEHLAQGIFVAEGEKVVHRFLGSGLAPVSLLMTPEWFEQLFPEGAGSLPCDAFVAAKKTLEKIVGFRMHQGIMAVGRLPTRITLDDLAQSAPLPKLLVALDGLVSAENVGVIVRNCAAFGVHGVITGKNSASPYLRRAVRNSMGGVFHVPVVQAESLAALLQTLRTNHSVQIVAAHLSTPATLMSGQLERNTCLVFGNEDGGVSAEVLAVCDAVLRIPMENGTDSLNVASASAVFLYEVRRQRTAPGR